MRRIHKIFTAVVFGAFAFSCATDTTEDLGVQVNGGQTTEITLSLEESRTHLGEAAEGIYPLYWSEGDKIAINGNESTEIAISENKNFAEFTFAGTLDYPYSVLYPASA